MTRKKQTGRGRFLAAGFLMVYAFTIGLQFLIPTPARADELTIIDRAKAYSAGRSLMECADNGGTNWKSAFSGSDYSLDEISTGDIWEAPRNPIINVTHNRTNSPSGYQVDSTDGNSVCTNGTDVLQLFKAIGVSSDQIGAFLVDAGILELSGDKAGYNLTDRVDSNSGRAAVMRSKIDRKLNINLTKPMPDDMAYVALSAAFKGCKASESKGGSKVVFVDAEGNKTAKYYAFGTDESISVGYGLPGDGGDDGKMACTTIAQGLAKTADAYAAVAKAAFDAGKPLETVSPLGGGGGDTQKTQCEASWTNPLNWLMCAVFNMFAEASDAFYNSILQPFLYTPPISTDSESRTFKAWSNFRVIGNIFLVITMLVVVFGQTIGGGIVDAYTAKKILPKLLTGAILINLSVYIVALMIDVTNVLGSGISQLLLMPFNGLAGFELTTSAGLAGAGSVLGAGILGAGSIVGFLSAGMAVFPLIIFTIVIPTFFAMLSVFATLVIRQGIILALLISSPIAFALYILPNTEQYFKKWWQLLFTTLMVYPIVMSIFAISSIMSLMIVDANKGMGAGSIASIVAFSLQIIPLFLVPYAFKMAGGALANLQSTLTGIREKSNGLIKSRREQAMKNYNSASIQGRQDMYQRGQSMQKTGGFVRKRAGRLIAAGVGGYNIEAAASAQRAQTQKEINDQIATGRDEEIRGLTVNKETSESRTYQGKKQFKSLGGAWIDEADVDAGHRRWKNDTFAQQAALSYEMRKAATAEEVQHISDNYGSVAASWGVTAQQAQGIFKGAGFENQGTHLEFKHTGLSLDTDSRGHVTGGRATLDYEKFVEETYQKKGAYTLAQMSGHTIEQLGNAYDFAEANGDEAMMAKIRGISETFVQRGISGGAQIGEANGQQIQTPVQVAAGAQGTATAQTYGSGGAAVNEGINWLARRTGALYQAPPATTQVITDNRPVPGSSQNAPAARPADDPVRPIYGPPRP